MKLGVITGRAWATKKVKELKACPLYLVQPVSSEQEAVGSALIVADPKILAAPGDLVVYVTSTDATQAFDKGFAPVNASIVELVEKIV